MNTISHFWNSMRNPEGWFTFKSFFEAIAKDMPDNANICTIGAWFGMSDAYLVVELANRGLKFTYNIIDPWDQGTIGEPEHQKIIAKYAPKTLYECFIENMREGGVLDLINPIKLTSLEAVKLFEDNSLEFVFIDGDHSYEAVKADILAWLPKVKEGGVISGDDWQWPQVEKAIREILPQYHTFGKAWYFEK